MAEFMLNRENISNLLIEDELKDSYLTYSMSVIVSRALPDVRDGLKPSQRRVLIAMNDLNLGPRSKYRKCAKIAGDTSGNYHPHGEQVIYPTLVRMAQPFNMRYMLVDGQGNFGSIDGDSPAAMRYTEARMTTATVQMMEDLEKDTVDYIPNYDESRLEPTVLPSKFPSLLCNGSSGIAVGMATSIPPHNVKEICEGAVKVIENPDITLEELMEDIQGPDFPTGGIICGRKGILDGYKTGRGRITLRARAHIETLKGGKSQIVVTELPYSFIKKRIIDKIVDVVKNEQVKGISDVRDESDKEGMRLVIETKRGELAEVVLNQLYKHTSLQSTFSIIMIALVNGRPETLSIKEMIQHFIDHRAEIIRRRTRFLLNKAEARAHLLEGFRIALDHIDEIITIIRGSSEVQEAKMRLMESFSFTEVQAKAILDMRLQRLTGMEREKIESEYAALQAEIKEYNLILNDKTLVMDIIKEDMYEIRDRFSDKRRTEIVDDPSELSIEDLIAEQNVAVTITHSGYINRVPVNLYRKQHRGGKGVIGMNAKEGDFVERLYIASTHDYIMFFTDMGKYHLIKVYDIPEMGRTSRGRAIVNLLHLAKDENITSMIPVRTFDEERFLFLATRNGIVKKTNLSAYGNPKKGGVNAINLEDNDKLIGVEITTGKDDIMLATRNGFAIRFNESECRPMGRVTRGTGGINLRKGDYVVSLLVVRPGDTVLTVAEKGLGKRTDFEDYRATRRRAKGVINMKTTDKTGLVVGVLSVKDEDELMLITKKGQIVRTPISGIRSIGRVTQGVKIISLKGKDSLVSIARYVPDDDDDDKENVAHVEDEENINDTDETPETEDEAQDFDNEETEDSETAEDE